MRQNFYARLLSFLFMLYFAYGSNMDVAQMKERCPESRLIGKASLAGYRLTFDKGSPSWGGGVADIVKDGNSQVWGLIYEVSEEDLKALDRYEGHPNFYRRVEITINDAQGKKQKAIAYEVVSKESFIPPSPRYLNIIKAAAKTYNFPKDYQEFLEGISTN